MITDDQLKISCIICPKFKALVKNLDIKKMADMPPINFSTLSQFEKQLILDWTNNNSNVTPQIIQDYISNCK